MGENSGSKTGHRYAAQDREEYRFYKQVTPDYSVGAGSVSPDKLENDPMFQTGHSCGTES